MQGKVEMTVSIEWVLYLFGRWETGGSTRQSSRVAPHFQASIPLAQVTLHEAPTGVLQVRGCVGVCFRG